ncbi:MAG TPA: hypothetical protein VES65_01215 [Solirubrobacteraceae bacterium]|nr:hypothetical protein [Solirubrobacteraceae bacterium]
MHEFVIFDCDGVLVDSEVISNEVLAGMLIREGLPTTLTEARRDYQGLLLSDILPRAQARLGRSLPPGWLAGCERSATRQTATSAPFAPPAPRSSGPWMSSQSSWPIARRFDES